VFHGRHGVRHTQHVAHFVDPVASRVDNLLADDVTVFSMYSEFAIRPACNIFNRIETIDFGASLAGLSCHRERYAGGIDVTIEWIPPGAE